MDQAAEAARRDAAVVYPESDGAPMGETELHVALLLDLRYVLKDWLRDRPDVYVGANMFLYYEEGNPVRCVCPDLFVAFGVRPGVRRTWKVWEEGGVFPQVVLELVSEDSKVRDIGEKKGLYELLGADEYYAYDPTGETMRPVFRAWRRGNGALLAALPGEVGGVTGFPSERLGLVLSEDGPRIRVTDPATGECLLYPLEVGQARRAEAEARRAAEEEVERLRAELERLRAGTPGA